MTEGEKKTKVYVVSVEEELRQARSVLVLSHTRSLTHDTIVTCRSEKINQLEQQSRTAALDTEQLKLQLRSVSMTLEDERKGARELQTMLQSRLEKDHAALETARIDMAVCLCSCR